MSDFPPTSRPSMERDLRDREKSQSDERSISHGIGVGNPWGSSKGKIVVQVDISPHARLSDTLRDAGEELATLGYQIRPLWGERFSSETVRTTIRVMLEEFFTGGEGQGRKSYDHDKAEEWVETLSKEGLTRVKALTYPRYKFVCHVSIGEHIGGGFHSGMKCSWDPDSDMYATYTYLGDNLFCVVTICGIYCY